jgi:hypothetical protein
MDLLPSQSTAPVKILTENGEVYRLEGVEFEPDNQKGDIMWLKAVLDE